MCFKSKKRNILLLISFLISAFICYAEEETIDIPISVLKGTGFEEQTEDEVKYQNQFYFNENYNELNNSKKEKKKQKEKKNVEHEFNSELKIFAGVNIASNAAIETRTEESKTTLGVLGGAEYIRKFTFLNGLEAGAGGNAYLIAWDNTNQPAAWRETIIDEQSNIISIPIYLLLRYNFIGISNSKILENLYLGAKGGYNLGIGNVPKASGGIYYGFMIGKRIGNFGFELSYSVNNHEIDYEVVTTTTASIKRAEETTTTETPVTLEKLKYSKIGLLLSYSFDFNFLK